MNRSLSLLAFLVGLVMVLVAVLYFIKNAHDLPSFFPGHVDASTGTDATHKHTKHGVAAAVVALGAFALAWFNLGPSGRGRDDANVANV